jgi:cell division control protein 45
VYRLACCANEALAQLHTLLLLNMGGILDLATPEWFGSFDSQLTVHVIDSSRPQNLSTMFAAGESAERIILWDDGEVDKLQDERIAWEALTVSSSRRLPWWLAALTERAQYEPEPDSDEESIDGLENVEAGSDEEDAWDEEDEPGDGTPSSSRKRRSAGDAPNAGKRRRLLREVSMTSLVLDIVLRFTVFSDHDE